MRPLATSHEFQPTVDKGRTYEAPALIEIGGVYELTLTGDHDDDDGGGHGGFCWHDKKWGGADGFTLNIHGISVTLPVSSC